MLLNEIVIPVKSFLDHLFKSKLYFQIVTKILNYNLTSKVYDDPIWYLSNCLLSQTHIATFLPKLLMPLCVSPVLHDPQAELQLLHVLVQGCQSLGMTFVLQSLFYRLPIGTSSCSKNTDPSVVADSIRRM